ncbi:MAG: hypothetical protein LW710_05280 [Burkholderiales bacterium]|jgi:hypothetical protein|uniref:hypothetical protein n=1 Tax=Limnobacter sp. TaxID=2003368 RepID=UPI0039222FCB|nr:hypothetical protein [Burkholderiales bacterium]
MNRWQLTKKQAGFVASYLIFGIGLLAAVGIAYGRLSTANEQGRVVQQTVEDVASQLEIIRGKVLLCGAVYPDGDHGQFNARHAYPAPATMGNRDLVNNVQCPGAPPGQQQLVHMPDGVPMPQSPPEFNPWMYEHTETNGIRLRLDPQVNGGALNARTRLLRQYPNTAVLDGDEIVFTILN